MPTSIHMCAPATAKVRMIATQTIAALCTMVVDVTSGRRMPLTATVVAVVLHLPGFTLKATAFIHLLATFLCASKRASLAATNHWHSGYRRVMIKEVLRQNGLRIPNWNRGHVHCFLFDTRTLRRLRLSLYAKYPTGVCEIARLIRRFSALQSYTTLVLLLIESTRSRFFLLGPFSI